MTQALLPSGSTTTWERALADAMPPSSAVLSAIGAMRRFKYVSPRPDMLPFLVWEYGLGELTPYVPNLYDLVDQGVRWQRLRGTVSAVAIGLAWIGYTATIEEAWTGRRFWNSFQLRFPTLPVADVPDLERIEGITALSVPLRSKLRRGVHQYDVGALEADESYLDGSMLDTESGISVTQAGTIWSFGRTHEFAHTLTESEGVAIGNWLEPVDSDLRWNQLNILWQDANFPWTESAVEQRNIVLANWFADKTLWVRFRAAGGAVIGYRRCRAVHPVLSRFGGRYAVGSGLYDPSSVGSLLYVEAMTQFEDAFDQTCTEVALVVGGAPTVGLKPGTQWLGAAQISGGVVLATKAVSIPMRKTVRDQVKFLIDFDNTIVPSLRFSFSTNSQYLPLLSEMAHG